MFKFKLIIIEPAHQSRAIGLCILDSTRGFFEASTLVAFVGLIAY